MRFTGLLILPLLLSACASIIEGSSDTVSIATVPPSQSSCSLSNQRGSWGGIASAGATVKRSRTTLDVACTDAATGVQGQQKLESGVEPWVFGNILFGGVPGLVTDWITGAAYDYPDNVTVPMGTTQATMEPQPQILSAPTPTLEPAPVAQQPAPFASAAPAVPAPQGAVTGPWQSVRPSEPGTANTLPPTPASAVSAPETAPLYPQGGSIAAPPIFIPPQN